MATNKKITDNDRTDLKMVVGLIGNALLSKAGIAQLHGLMSQAKDPTGLMAHIIYHAVSQVHEQLIKKNLKVSNKIWIARGGVVDQAIAEVAKVLAGMSGNKDIINPQLLEEVRKQVVELLHDQEVNAGGPGISSVHTKRQSTPDTLIGMDSVDTGFQGGVIPPGEAGGSHGPNRMPAPPMGLLGGQ